MKISLIYKSTINVIPRYFSPECCSVLRQIRWGSEAKAENKFEEYAHFSVVFHSKSFIKCMFASFLFILTELKVAFSNIIAKFALQIKVL